ncbi:AAA family ATPase [Psychrobacter sp. LV10R520-6]|uniref:AAA family ATPase n=1 Tax=Psychrobacter sp. LV10R520-6 TaxID=1415574 RepID=UPI0024CB9963|nr:AAA family ATPase [Psychrobacter sp. LV10R520-6]SNT70929.1 Predicted ATP-binding protein involved in virulence [Psychrobacter sp. LV10R520-6]
MEIKKLTLNNLGRFENLEVDFAPTEDNRSNVTVFIGNNGAGKTSILEALATSLSWFVARMRSEKGSGTAINELVIINDAPAASITLQLYDDVRIDGNRDIELSYYQWTLVKARKGRKSDKPSTLSELTKLADNYRQLLTDDANASLPLIAYYPVERSVLDIPLKIMGKHSFTQIEGYESSLNQGVDFRRFFEWFREREDIENEEESRRYESFVENEFSDIDALMSDYEKRLKNLDLRDSDTAKKELGDIQKSISFIRKNLENEYKDKQLNAVRTAISTFMPDLSNIRVQRKPRLHMAVDKGGKSLNVMQLSQGEKSMMALVGDIARRLAMMNPALDNPLHGDGIILIDEVDMHLHPSWQRNLVQRFTDTFPNCQIILSTHSPLVISDQKDILVYLLSNGEIDALPPLYGEDVNTVLLEVMDTDIRDHDINDQLSDLLDAIHDADISAAKTLLETLEVELPSGNMELAKARLLLRKKELQIAKNN